MSERDEGGRGGGSERRGRDEGRGREREGESEGEGVGGEGGGCSLIYSLSLPLFLTLSFPLTQIYVQEEHCWMLDGPGCAGRRRQASIAASHASSLAVPCEEERIPRCALRASPCETDKVYTWFAIGVQEAGKVCSKFTCRFA